ncbi:MAG TPA: AI-2E family transporter [Candidatus Baltobacteraceae bacterium]
MKTAVNWRKVVFIGGVILVVLFALWFAERIPRTITIFAIAAFIAFGLQPLVAKLEARRIGRPYAIAIVFTALLLIIAVGIFLVVPSAIAQTQTLASNAPSLLAGTQSWIVAAENWTRSHFPSANIPAGGFDLSSLGGAKLQSLATSSLSGLGGVVLTTGYVLANILFIGFSALVLSLFFLSNDREIGETFSALFPERKRGTARKLAGEITALFGGYISGQVIVSAITGTVVAVLSALVGFKFPLILGIITAVAYAIPIFGMLVAQLIALILCAPSGPWVLIWVQVIMFVMARISDNILVPKIMGDSVGVSPIGVMFAVLAGGELFGLPGLVLGIPAAALIKILWRYFGAPYIHAQLDDEPAKPQHRAVR